MARKKIVVTGASGFVAGSVLHFGLMDYEIHAFSRGAAPLTHPNLKWHSINPDDRKSLSNLLESIRPDAIIHLAALADIDYCENNSEIANAVNVGYTTALAEICAELGIRMVFVSTDNVYDGKRPSYTAESDSHPVNHYGQTKVDAELVVREIVPDHAIARLALVMGFPIIGGGNSFLMRMIAQWEKGESVGVPDNEIRSPIDVVTAGHALLELATNDFRGTILLGGTEGLNRIDLVRQVADGFGYSQDQVHPFDPTNLPGRADRPRSVTFDVSDTNRILDTPMVGIEEAIGLLRPFQSRAN